MAIEYGLFIVDGLHVTGQTLTLAGVTTGFTNAEGIQGINQALVPALARVGAAGWALSGGYPDNANQTQVLIFSRQQ